MKKIPLKLQSIIPRIDGISEDMKVLKELGRISEAEFNDEKPHHFDVAKLRLREALEGVFNIGAHILSRLEGGRTTEYKEIAQKLGELGIVDRIFADGALAKMAGYRNRLTHFYHEITRQEMREIIQKGLGDFDVFLRAVKDVLEHPEKFGLTAE